MGAGLAQLAALMLASRPSARTAMRRSITKIGPHEIHALEAGAGRDAIVLLHGLSGSARWWERNVRGLARSCRVIVPDLIGFGRSRITGRLPGIPQLRDLLLDWFETLAIRRLALVGHSMGGQLSVHIAARSPERVDRLVLVDPSGIPRPMRPVPLLRSAAQVGALWRWGDPSFLGTIATDAWTAGPRTLVRAIWNIARDDVRPLLPQVQAPTLVIWGQHDGLVPPTDALEFRRRIPGARLIILRGAAHNPMVDRPEAFNRIVLRFLEGEAIGR